LGEFGRVCGTRLWKTGDFDFKEPPDNDEKLRYIELIDPGCECVFSEIFVVPDSAEPFSRGEMHLQMLLAEPGNDPRRFNAVMSPMPGLRSIAQFDPDIQVSAAYTYSPGSSFLLLVNASSPGSLIREILAIVEDVLSLAVDVYNLSVSGTLIDTTMNNENILMRYSGKTLIILANPFDYFGYQGRVAYEFIDPWLISRLLKAGTNILLLGLEDADHLCQNWGKMVATPGFPVGDSRTDLSFQEANVDSLLQKFRQMAMTSQEDPELRVHTAVVKKGFLRSHQSCAQRSAKKLSDRLAKLHPSRGYSVQAEYENASKTEPAKVIVRECLLSNINILASTTQVTGEFSYLPGEFSYLIAATLPFGERVKMLWTGTSKSDSGVQTEACLATEISQLPETVSLLG
jgi:hypothetical protein